MSADPIQFTLIEDGEDVRPFRFSTNKIQIGCDASRGDNLLIDLPAGKRHVRAKVLRSDDYVELEVTGGPIWLQGSRMDEGDVAELTVGDILVFGTRKAVGATLRFEYAREAEIVMDDVADWSVAASPKKKRGKTAEDDMLFDEEKDPTEGMNIWEKTRYKYRQQYKKFTAWRKKAARVKYWISLVQVGVLKARGLMIMAVGFAALGTGWYNEAQSRIAAQEAAKVAAERDRQATLYSSAAANQADELQVKAQDCCPVGSGGGAGQAAASEAIMETFEDEDLNPEKAFPMPDGQTRSLASIIAPSLTKSRRAKVLIDTTLDRVCSPNKEKRKMAKVQAELRRYNIHEAYSFIPFVESLWCELAVSFTGPRGMMQFTRRTAQEAFRQVDSTQSDIPDYEWDEHHRWLVNASSRHGGDYYAMLALCPPVLSVAYRQKFYQGETNPDYPNRLDPDDPRTDWEAATGAAFGWLEKLDQSYASKGFAETDRIMLAMTAYNQGQGEVQMWINHAKNIYKTDKEGSLTYPQVYAGALKRLDEVKDPEKRRQVKEGMGYAPKIMGRYLYTKPRLDDGCRK